MNKNRKGFTIVELVIVIAIIAILAAVLIPTFASLIAKANVSADTQLVRNLNTALTTEKAGGENNKTMNDALKMAKNAGYDIDRIVSKSGNNIGWDSKNDRFVLIDAKNDTYIYPTDAGSNAQKIQNAVDYFVIYKEIPTEQKYSIYLSKDATLTGGTVTVSVGFDAGENENVTAVNYTSEATQDVIIRTNSTNTVLTVTAKNSTVKHYDVAGKVLINEVASKSYHEFGEVVGNLQIFKGRLELTSSANVSTVLVSSAAANDVKVEVVNGAQVGTVAPTTDNAKTDVETATTIPAEAKQTEKVTPNTDFAGGLGTERSPYLIANAEQFSNLNKLDWTKSYYIKQTEDITITTPVVKFAGVYDGGNNKLTYNYNGEKFGYVFGETAGYSEFKNINIVMGKTAVALLWMADWGTAHGATFDNISFSSTSAYSNANTNNFGFVVVNALYTDGTGTPVYTFSNITNNVNLQNEGTCTGVFVGSGPCFNVKTVLNYANCVNNGEIIGTNVGFLYGNEAYIESVEESASEINVSNCINNNLLMSNKESGKHSSFAPGLTELNNKYENSIGGSFVTNSYFAGKTIVVNQEGNKFTINTTDNSVEYKLAFDVSAIYNSKNNTAWTADNIKDETALDNFFYVSNGIKYFIDLPIDTTKSGALSGSFKAYDKKTAASEGFTNLTFENGYTIVVKDNTTYLIFDTAESCYINCKVSLKVYAYANGVLQGVKTVK
mgnify:CR=1 FL=1